MRGGAAREAAPDIVTADAAGSTVSVLRNQASPGAAVPLFEARREFAAGLAPTRLRIGDIDGDGKVDVVVADPAGGVVVMTNASAAGAVALGAPVAVPVPAPAVGLALAPGAGGRSDVIVSLAGTNTVAQFSHGANGVEMVSSWGTREAPGEVAAADLDLDGRADLLATGPSMLQLVLTRP